LTSQQTKHIPRLFAAFAASAVMLTMAQPPISIWPAAWAAYIPFILVCSPKYKTLPLFVAAYIISACFWLGNLYWMSYVTISGWIAFCLYTALLWPILALTLRWCRAKRIPLVIAAPILVVGAEQMQGLFLGGFYWFYLGHSQYSNTNLIQIADIFGASGVSFLVAMVNGLLAELIIAKRQQLLLRPANFIKIFAVCAVLAAAIIYGVWRTEGQSDNHITDGPIVAAVQTNTPQSVKQSFAAEEQIFDELLKQSKESASAGAKLVIWPETMVQAILEPQVLRLLDDSHLYRSFDKTIGTLAAEQGVSVLVGTYGGSPRIEENFDIRLAEKYNAAFLYTPDGNQAPEKYSKIHLVPFGETLPFENIGFIHNLLLKMTPYDFDYTLDAGTEYTVFKMQAPDANQPYKFSVMICYEDAVPAMARRFALDKHESKRIDWLVNISNDGWFVRFENDKVLPSSELAQHTAICAFRAVENRLAIVRSVNTGISCLIDTFGRIRDGYKTGNLPHKAFDRRGVDGWFADTVPIDDRITFFSRHGQWLDLSCQLCLAGLIIVQLVERFILKQRTKGTAKPVGK